MVGVGGLDKLTDLLRLVANHQVRNVGTIVGNISLARCVQLVL